MPFGEPLNRLEELPLWVWVVILLAIVAATSGAFYWVTQGT